MEFLKTCNKGTQMKGWESPFIFSYQQHGIMIEKQRLSDLNPLYTLASVTRYPEHTM
jgi:hypothetical protein